MVASILLLSNTESVIKSVRIMPARYGHTVEVVSYEASSLEQLRERDVSAFPDIVMVDGSKMRDEIVALARQDPILQSLPIILLTNGGHEGDILGYANIADVCLTKPFNPQEMEHIIQRLLLGKGLSQNTGSVEHTQ